jgi:hypothetical protein
MSFRDHKLGDLIRAYSLRKDEQFGLFAAAAPVRPSEGLLDALGYNAPLAADIGTEKARSELIVAPLLVELKRHHCPQVSVFSGIELNVDPDAGLNGVCDFLLGGRPDQLFLVAPVIAVVEAKNEDIKGGVAQCVAEMLAAQLFNEREGTPTRSTYGAVTTGTVWKFLRLTDKALTLDLDEYLISQPERILGVLVHMVATAA